MKKMKNLYIRNRGISFLKKNECKIYLYINSLVNMDEKHLFKP